MRVIVPALALALALAGCATTGPTLTLTAAAPPTSAPAPGTGAPWTPAAPPPEPAAPAEPSATPEPAPAAVQTPPPPKEFAAADALTDIHFDFDKADLGPGEALILESDAEWFKDHPNLLVLIEGHADERGTNEYNLALGERRAKATLSYLAAQGIPADRLALISYGKERPFCAERTEECWAENRRAHFLVKPTASP